ncbi:Hereditary spastic paraplegia protein strumpellin, putative [Angomonas deanei]|uniref:Hereditary spastic paraplegia protein strumpellin, putative n=1 Tax=Angomonas deanei TaxID=59799 RepID=A0A7G2C775_9TRYP|nr:Hereditary spastic paraplegia protein strumpellin, putative [Angomonas deanei]
MISSIQKYVSEDGPSDFLSDDCGKALVKMCARGGCIIGELLKLSERIPDPFKCPEQSEYKEVLCDFTYFKNQTAFDDKIRSSPSLSEKDDTFYQTHIELLTQFFHLFKAVLGYVTDLNALIRELKEGVFVSQTVESAMSVLEGRQLLSEAYHLYAVMLLLLDYKIGGKTREFILVCYIRYQGAAGDAQSTDITQLCRCTGYEEDNVPPKGYPVAFFRRVPVDTEVIARLIARVRTDDMYQMSANYPSPDHRCVAVAMQGALLYTLLFFCPDILELNKPVMREIVDKHFSDNWVINYYLGFTADLTFVWNDFPAAKTAIEQTVQLENVTYNGGEVLRRVAVLTRRDSSLAARWGANGEVRVG